MTMTSMIVCAVIGLIVAGIVISILKGQLKSAYMQHGASSYEVKGSFKLEDNRNVYLYKTLDKRYVPQKKE